MGEIGRARWRGMRRGTAIALAPAAVQNRRPQVPLEYRDPMLGALVMHAQVVQAMQETPLMQGFSQWRGPAVIGRGLG